MQDPFRELVYLWPENHRDIQKDTRWGKNLKAPLKMEGIKVGGLARQCCWPRQREGTFQGLH